MPSGELLRDFLSAREEVERASSELKEKQKSADELEQSVLDAMLAEGVSSVSIDGRAISVKTELIPSGIDGKDALCALLSTVPECAFLVKPTYHELQFRSWYREQVENGTLPEHVEGAVKVHQRNTLSVRKK